MKIGKLKIIVNPKCKPYVFKETAKQKEERELYVKNHEFLESIGLKPQATGSTFVPYAAENEKYRLTVSCDGPYSISIKKKQRKPFGSRYVILN